MVDDCIGFNLGEEIKELMKLNLGDQGEFIKNLFCHCVDKEYLFNLHFFNFYQIKLYASVAGFSCQTKSLFLGLVKSKSKHFLKLCPCFLKLFKQLLQNININGKESYQDRCAYFRW
jgi:hypothetical protein